MEGIKRGASDLHFSVGNAPVFRINDQLEIMDGSDFVSKEFMGQLVEALLDDKEKKKLDDNREVVITHDFDKNLRFKVNIFYQRDMLSSTLRYISAKVPTVASLNLNSTVTDLINLENGLVIVSGSYGSGRSTTIAALIEQINLNQKKYILTVENPIEYLFANKKSIIEQREVGKDTNSFVDALSYFQEENADVLYIEEMTDIEVIPHVLEIARGNALVFTSVSADTAPKTIARILDSFKSYDQERVRDLLSSSLQAVVCQRVLPKIGGGITAIHEIMLANNAVKASIISGNLSQLDNIITTSREGGMTSFDNSLAEAVKKGVVSQDEALKSASDKQKVQNLL